MTSCLTKHNNAFVTGLDRYLPLEFKLAAVSSVRLGIHLFVMLTHPLACPSRCVMSLLRFLFKDSSEGLLRGDEKRLGPENDNVDDFLKVSSM